eukprot:TRINITY_DN6970_c0_g1_i1.p1 TRINITY_DN6970_c0_g1~~TRINITY_DN6970_c0_g1_i1.p1  ORF type:complete len:318 (+),score=28.42 TRINITY_DN6970_c0_g1_i1:88-954(+)
MENPYWLSLTSPNPSYVCRIGMFAAIFGVCSKTVELLVKSANAEKGSFSAALAALSNPLKNGEGRSGKEAATCICSTIHALGTSAASIWAVLALQFWSRGDPDGSIASLWSWALAFSQGYFIADGIIYGLDSVEGETWVSVHHAWMTLAHHPIGELTRCCRLMGVGDASRAVWLSSTGYWSEISTVFLNIRWLQHRWLKKHSFWYSLNSAALLVTYPAVRVVGIPIMLYTSLFPHWTEYQKSGLGSLAVFTTVTYSALVLMSTYFFSTLIGRGLNRALTFTPRTAKKD